MHPWVGSSLPDRHDHRLVLSVGCKWEYRQWFLRRSCARVTEQTLNLMTFVQTLNLNQGISNSLDAKLQNIQAALAAVTAGDRPSACNMLNALVNEVQAQTGKTLPLAQAADLFAAARRIQAVLGC